MEIFKAFSTSFDFMVFGKNLSFTIPIPTSSMTIASPGSIFSNVDLLDLISSIIVKDSGDFLWEAKSVHELFPSSVIENE